MYSPAFQVLLVDARIEDLRDAPATLVQPRRGRESRDSRAAGRLGLRSRAGIRRLVFADPSRAH